MGLRGPKSLNEKLQLVAPTRGQRSPPASDQPPSHLSPDTKAWWKEMLTDFVFERTALRLLQVAAESWDRKEQARIALSKHGMVFKDDRGGVRPRPEVQIERDAR